MTDAPAESQYRKLRRRLGLLWVDMTPEQRRDTLEKLYLGKGQSFRSTAIQFTTLLGLSVFIAVFGLHANSPAVVIGAMLVSPLMDPILATSAALLMGWRNRLIRNLGLLAFGCAFSILLAAFLTKFVPERIVLPDQILSRTNPTILDLLIAIGAGLAGAYTLVRGASTALPGVAIAVALVPPLVVTGILLERARIEMAKGAMLLFGTNLVAILLAATVIFLLTGFTPRGVRQRGGRRIWSTILGMIVGVALITVPLLWYTQRVFQRSLIRDAVTHSVQEWTQYTPQQPLRVSIEGDKIILDLAGESPPLALSDLADKIASKIGADVKLTVRWVQRTEQTIEREFQGRVEEFIEEAVEEEEEKDVKEEKEIDVSE